MSKSLHLFQLNVIISKEKDAAEGKGKFDSVFLSPCSSVYL